MGICREECRVANMTGVICKRICNPDRDISFRLESRGNHLRETACSIKSYGLYMEVPLEEFIYSI